MAAKRRAFVVGTIPYVDPFGEALQIGVEVFANGSSRTRLWTRHWARRHKRHESRFSSKCVPARWLK